MELGILRRELVEEEEERKEGCKEMRRKGWRKGKGWLRWLLRLGEE